MRRNIQTVIIMIMGCTKYWNAKCTYIINIVDKCCNYSPNLATNVSSTINRIENKVICKNPCSSQITYQFLEKKTLKTLLNILEAPVKKIVELWCLCCMMMFRWTNKQSGIQWFWHLCGHYQDIYDWISPLNKPSYHLF